MPETTENYHRIPVSSGHGDHEIRTITISAKEGIKALYCVDCKEVITYLFDKDKWTMEEAKEWVEEHKEDSFGSDLMITKGVIPFHSYPKASEDTPWDGPGEVAKADVDDLKKMCTWYDSENQDVKSSYKLPHHKAEGYTTVWNGVKAAMSRLFQSGTKIPDSDRKGCYNHLAKHYSEFDKEAPEWGKDYSDDELQILFGVENMDKNLRMRTKEQIASTVRFKSYGQVTVNKSVNENESDGVMRVRGYFTDDGQDEMGDIITRDATEKAIEKWRKWGNIRTMHEYPSGRVERIGTGDGLAWNEIETVPVDEQTKKLIDGNVLKAYSVGIIPREYEINEDAIGDEDPWWFFPLIIHDYDMIEISYVDHPANYSATINDVSVGKSREFAHRAVLYKNSELIGEGDMDVAEEKALEEEVEEKALEEEVGADPEAEIELELVEPTAEVPLEFEPVGDQEELAEEKEIDDSAEEEIVEKDASEESEFNVELAVRDLNKQVADLEDFVHGELAALIVDKVLEALANVTDAELDGGPEAEAMEESGDGTEKGAEDFVDRIGTIIEETVARQLEKFTDDIIEAVSYSGRKAKVIVAGEEEPEDNDAADRYLEMNSAERRKMMVGALQGMYPDK